ncbi:MAG TPA: hypothetical protein DCQ98_09650 [Planctomycetaceae bacterium]|nr:hypothetical protein [Planctomycetaceae bacterium]HRF01461.1 hypothetical protein [Pirellulaceae bacterium]
MNASTISGIVCPACESSVGDDSKADGRLRPCPHCGFSFEWILRSAWDDSRGSEPWRDLLARLPMPQTVVEHTSRRAAGDVSVTASTTPLPPMLAPPRASLRSSSELPIPPTPPPPLIDARGTTERRLEGSDIAEGSARDLEVGSEPIAIRVRTRSIPLAGADATAQSNQAADSADDPSDTVSDPAHRRRTGHHQRLVLTVVVLLGTLGAAAVWIALGGPWRSGDSNADRSERAAEASGSSTAERITGTASIDANWPIERLGAPGELWDRVSSYLVQVDLTEPTGTRRSAGVLVDSRGWIITVGSAETTGWRVALAPADGPRVDAGAPAIRVDGPIARRPGWGLVVLQVDPAPFRAFGDLKFAGDGAIGSDWTSVGPGTDGHWLSALLDLRGSEWEHGFAIPDRFDAARLGGLLLDRRGLPFGVARAAEDGSRAGVVQGAELVAWIDELRRDEPTVESPVIGAATGERETDPSEASTSGAPAPDAMPGNGGASEAADVPPTVLDSIDRMRELHERLIAAEELSEPQTYRLAAELAWRTTVAEELEDSTSIEGGARLLFGQGAATVRDAWMRSAWKDDTALGRINRQAILSWPEVRGFWGYAVVEDPPGIAPRTEDGDHVVLRLIDTEQRIAVPVSLAHDDLKVDSRWLVWGSVEPRKRLTLGPERPSVPVVHSRYLIEEPEVLIPAGAGGAADSGER